ncbi:LOW QUALITY PROTEIN: hypothetical protein PHMEG_0006598 [Phytophthora megakarya]|uniref:Peptidase A2 domain-containing protein n=1 Tax=Phytophthora megakarya TaxID=4795 RepID=A0A225WNM3_9STRA|nr:LOW QUALITY PROTEIN: hypothetical protein PHMEG_0006598 [Phytophthora megakarya]
MRAVIIDAIENTRTRILLDTGANVSVISAAYAKPSPKLGGTGNQPWSAGDPKCALVKITLGWERVCEFKMWIMNHSAGVDVVSNRLHDLRRLFDEVEVPLVKPAGATDDEPYGTQVVGGPAEDLRVARVPISTKKTLTRNARVMDPKDQTNGTHRDRIPQGQTRVGPFDERIGHWCYKHYYGYPEGNSHVGWGMSCSIRKEKELYECRLSEQPLAVERKKYTTPERILARTSKDLEIRGDGENHRHSTKTYEDSETSVTAGFDEDANGGPDTRQTELSDTEDDEINPTEESVDMLELTYISVMQEIEAEIASGNRSDDDDLYEYIPKEMEQAGYAHGLAILLDLTEPSSTVLDYKGPKVTNESLSGDKQRKLVEVLNRHEGIMIASGNALPPPLTEWFAILTCRGICLLTKSLANAPASAGEIVPVVERAIRARLITFSDSSWTSPIVIVLKKNGVDIRLCIDYKRINAVTTIMEYAMPLVDDLRTDMEACLWFFSLDAASWFWAVMMTERARKVSAFVCALGHFE